MKMEPYETSTATGPETSETVAYTIQGQNGLQRQPNKGMPGAQEMLRKIRGH